MGDLKREAFSAGSRILHPVVTVTRVLSAAVCDSVAELRKKVAVEHEQVKQKDQTPKASYGYGGKFGVERDRMDKVYGLFSR